MFFLYRFGQYLARTLPRKISYGLAHSVAFIYYHFARSDRYSIRKNLEVILSCEAVGKKSYDHYSLQIFKNFARYLVNFLSISKMTDINLKEKIDIVGIEHLDNALEKGKGAILLSLHMGSWELGAAIFGALGYPVNAIVLEHKDSKINDFFINQRSLNGVKSIPLGLSIKSTFKALKRNEVLAIVGDKDYTSGGVEVNFFGKKAMLPKGPAAISLKTGAPIIFTIITHEESNKFKLTLEPAIFYEKSPASDYKRDVNILMGKYISYFEKYIKKYPEQWYVFEEIWKQH